MKKHFVSKFRMRDTRVDSEGTWAVSYGDMVTLLLTFFVLFFSTNVVQDKQQMMDAALMESLFDKEKERDNDKNIDKSINENMEKNLDKNQAMMVELGTKVGIGQNVGVDKDKGKDKDAGIDKDKGKDKDKGPSTESGIDKNIAKDIGNENVNKNDAPDGVKAQIPFMQKIFEFHAGNMSVEIPFPSETGPKADKIGHKIVIRFPNLSFFPFAEIDVNKTGVEELSKFAKKFVKYSGHYILGIHAFTDIVPVIPGKKRFNDNLELSALRAISAMRILQQEGVPLDRMRLGGYGEFREMFAKMSEEERKKISYRFSDMKDQLALARKVVLVIEPETPEGL